MGRVNIARSSNEKLDTTGLLMGGARPDTTAHAATVPRSRFARKPIGVPFRLKVGEKIER